MVNAGRMTHDLSQLKGRVQMREHIAGKIIGRKGGQKVESLI